MNRGELLTRLTIWLALCAYAIGAGALLLSRSRVCWLVFARLAWTIGCAFFLAHVASAFTYYHHWSHAAAYQETALRTGELTGLRWGGGIYLNYLLALAWLADVGWWWLSPESFARRSRSLTAVWQGFFFFMVFNGAVVFGAGPVRWLGVVICGNLAALWWRQRRARIASRPLDA
jgi:hypothetical protein